METEIRHQPVPGAPATAANPSSGCEIIMIIKKIAFLTIFIVLSVAALPALAASVVTFVAACQVPNIPYVKLTSVSTTIRNASGNLVTADFDATFLLQKYRAEKRMIFDHLAASAFGTEAGPLAPALELCGYGDRSCSTILTALFRLNDVSLWVGEWDVVIGDDDIHHAHRRSGSLYVKFGLSANVTHKGKTWSKRRIPIKVTCKYVKFPLSYTAGTATHDNIRQLASMEIGIIAGLKGCGMKLNRGSSF
ncbi:hypothetical protein L484_001271 [Morus notabilis]|uniref:Late embryogenesis abundant protein LEA-2 subgroup domain-containing protein n=1 Tax=Morus notabilis TaxID=981085 RepID=W9SLD1_9ROSA|nr:hypothetical protein L484_001271 [Morus notabilis]